VLHPVVEVHHTLAGVDISDGKPVADVNQRPTSEMIAKRLGEGEAQRLQSIFDGLPEAGTHK
jgi:hypothetical protein